MKKIGFTAFYLLTSAIIMIVQGCTNHHGLVKPENIKNNFYGQPREAGEHIEGNKAASLLYAINKDCKELADFGAGLNYRVDQPINTNPIPVPPELTEKLNKFALSPGDLLELQIENGEGFNGHYVVDTTGTLNIPLLSPVYVRGMPVHYVEEKIQLELIKQGLFKPKTAAISLKVLQLAPVDVSVTGAVFQPGRVLINNPHANSVQNTRTAASGDYAPKRLMSEAIRAASGIRPDAKLDQVILIRGGWQIQVDLSGILTGYQVKDYPLIAGDQIIVPTTGCFQAHLVRPSQITPKGFRVFMSNLTDSAMNNSSAGVGRYATNIPYGSRLLQAAVSANCVGGKQWTSAPRHIMLASNNPLTGETQVVMRSVEELVRQSYRDDINPFLMPNDAVACYDSDVSNLRDIAKSLIDVLAPFKLL